MNRNRDVLVTLILICHFFWLLYLTIIVVGK